VLLLAFGSCNSDDGVVTVEPTPIPFSLFECLDGHSPGRRNLAITSQPAFDSLVGAGVCGINVINFQLYTLIGRDGTAGGCSQPFYQLTFFKDDVKKQIVSHLLIIEHGSCDPAFLNYLWALIPRVDSTYSVVFQKEVTNDRPVLD
jgi:hypothetical protein